MQDQNNLEELGMLAQAHEGQKLSVQLEEIIFYRYPVRTRLALIDENLIDFIKESLAKVEHDDKTFYAIASKVVSITRGYYKKESDIKISRLAKFLVRFVKKWPNDPGYALPGKIQMAMDMVGLPRFLFALVGGSIMKYIFQKPGYFYKLAGKNIGGIDGFVPWMYPEPLRGYGFYTPQNPFDDAEFIEKHTELPFAILDGNNVEQIVLAYGCKLKSVLQKLYMQIYGKDASDEEIKNFLLKILHGNPQGQSGNTPILVVKYD
jgi:hypothetical protein